MFYRRRGEHSPAHFSEVQDSSRRSQGCHSTTGGFFISCMHTVEPYCADQTRGCCLHTLMHQGHTPLRPLWKACSTLSIRRMTWRLAKVPGPSPNRNRGGEKHQTVDVIRRPVIQTSSPEAHRLLTSQPTAFFSAGAPVPHTQGSDGRSCSMTSASLPIHYNE